jgi:NADPH:quinone reductase-like Zn-dependent oxidoreductase
VPVSDRAGDVVAVGDGVSRVRVGERVAATFGRWQGGKPTHAVTSGATLGAPHDGMLAEYVLVDEDMAVRVPDYLSFEEASTLPIAGVTAWHALFVDQPIRPGDSVLVQGTGGVAIFAIQLARAAGAYVFVVSSSDEKLARAKEIGAHEGLNYVKEPNWDAWVHERTNGVGVDLVLDVAGSTLTRSLGAVRMGGQVSSVGFLGGAQAPVDMFPLLVKKIRIQGIWVGTRDHFEDMNRALVQHRLHPVIDRTYAFEKADEAIAALRDGAYVGKLVIKGVPGE